MSLIAEKQSIEQDHLTFNEIMIAKIFAKSGSFLFVGDDKKQIEDILEALIKKLSCEKLKNAELEEPYCGKCSNCQQISARQHPDICWIGTKGTSSTIKIEDIRVLKEKINLKPFQNDRKIFIIQDAHRMRPEAANALLKTLEEPPQNASVVLIAKSATELLPTVVSRCQIVRFSSGGGDLNEDQDQISELIFRIIDSDDVLGDLSVYEDVAALERGKVDQLLCELANVMRDILMVQLQIDKVTMMSCQSPERIKQWVKLFAQNSADQIIKQIIDTKSFINKNANIKLAIDLLVKSIARNKIKNN